MLEACITGKGLGTMLFSDFNAFVCESPHPIGRTHLLSVPKGSLSDVRSCRRKSLKALEYLKEKGLEALDEKDRAHAILGFSLPADYNHLHLHVIVPPITNFLLFRTAHWYSYYKLVNDIEKKGQVEIIKPADSHEIDPWVVKRDWQVRSLLG